MSTVHHLTVGRTARYHQLGELSEATRRIWLVCHGYGQLAAYFIRHFAFLTATDPTTVVIAPEGLSRFYLQGAGGRVGASWMTSDDRLHEINDQVNFLNQLVDNVISQCSPDVKVLVFGFSQGTATVGRWLAQARFRPAHLVLWAGTFPPDLEPTAAQRLLAGLPVSLVIGEEDEYLTLETIAQQQQFLQQAGALTELLVFSGKHELNQPILRQLAQRQ